MLNRLGNKTISTREKKSQIIYQLSSGGEPLGGVRVETDYVLTGCAVVEKRQGLKIFTTKGVSKANLSIQKKHLQTYEIFFGNILT